MKKILLHVHMEITRRWQAWQNKAAPGELKEPGPPIPASGFYRPYTGIAGEFRFLHTPDSLSAMVFEVLSEAAACGALYTEFYFNLVRWMEAGLSPNETFLAIDEGRKRARAEWGIESNSIVCIRRDFAVELAERVVEAVCTATGPKPVGITLAGDEQLHPLCHEFTSAFGVAKKNGLGITIHAGEHGGPENIWFALEELGAQRISHGLSATEDPLLMRHLAAHNIMLEIALTSNQWSGVVSDLGQHPIGRFVSAGIPVSLNTDNPLLLGTNLDREFEIAHLTCGLSSEVLQRTALDSIAYSFATPPLKQSLFERCTTQRGEDVQYH